MEDVQQWIKSRKEWAMTNYERGGDVFVETWDDNEFQLLLQDARWNFDNANEMLESLRSIFEDQQADARYYKENG